MSLDTISISDIGKSLVAIEAEVASNNNSIKYYQAEIGKLHDKNASLNELAKTVIRAAIPATLSVGKGSL
jgi:hypothetical protein